MDLRLNPFWHRLTHVLAELQKAIDEALAEVDKTSVQLAIDEAVEEVEYRQK